MSFSPFIGDSRIRNSEITFSRENLKTGPVKEPVTLEEAKEQIRVTSSSEDTFITNLIASARISAELYCERVFINQTWQIFFDFLGNVDSLPWWDGVRQGAINSFFPLRIEITRPPLSLNPSRF